MAGFRDQLALLGRHDYGLLWWGGLASRMGDAFTLLAVSWLLAERGDAGLLALTLVAYEVAAIAGGLLLSGLVDQVSRRRLMVVDSVVRAGAVAVIPLVGLWHAPGAETLIPAMALLGFWSPTADVGFRAMTVDLVAPHELPAANALEQVQWTASWLVGPALAGLVIAGVGALTSLWVDAASFLVFAGCLALMSRRADVLHRTGPRAAFRRELGEGLAYVAREPLMRTIVQIVFTARLAEGMWLIALPFLVRDAGAGAAALGLLVAALGAGSVVGALISGAVPMRFSATRGLSVLIMAEAALLAAVGVDPPLWVVGLLLAVMGLAFGPSNVILLTLRQRTAPPELLGRVLSVTMMLNRAGQPAGNAAGGAALGALGPAAIFALAGGIMATSGAVSLLWRSWRDLPLTADGRWTSERRAPAHAAEPGHGATKRVV